VPPFVRSATGPNDPAFDAFRLRERQLNTRLHRRGERSDAKFIAEGDLVVMRAIQVGHVPERIICDPSVVPALDNLVSGIADSSSVEIVVADEATRKAATGLGVALNIVGLFPKPGGVDLDTLVRRNERILVLAQVDNPTNVGAIVRSAAAFGFTGLVLDAESADPYARRALRVAMGTTFQLDIARLVDLDGLFDVLSPNGFQSFAMTPDVSAVPLDQVRPSHRMALLLGSERDGLADLLMARATHRVRIPMADGVDSLNVAAAAAVACYGLTSRIG
jgi:tRNA G18 (ribose-2'-O)-methylase SpoU